MIEADYSESVLNRRSPVLQLGTTGKADTFYVRVVDGSHIAFGLDHWGFAATEGSPVEIDPRRSHVIVIGCGALRAATGHGGREDRTYSLSCDGRAALSGTCDLYPVSLTELVIGRNPAGSSTADPTFHGTILHSQINL